MSDLLERVLGADPPPFALLHRPERDPGTVELLTGPVSTVDTLAQLALPAAGGATLAMVPFRQIAERGYACVDDGEPLLAMAVAERVELPLVTLLHRLPRGRTELAGGHFDPPDDAYAETVRRIVKDEIGTGEGANFVARRSYVADIVDYTPAGALAFFRRLVQGETGAYWTFAVHTGDRTFVGASPERHVSLSGGTATMNPISGTYRYGPDGPSLPGLLGFLSDRKESDELYMVLDEELKMMARICDGGGRVVGPYLREMARLAHTEYLIEGPSTRDPRDVLRETMFAPTVTGSPLESACKVIARHESGGRGYYAGVAALLEPDAVDSAILIRTADIDAGGRMRIGVGATLVRHSDPDSEVAETRAKAAGLLAALRAEEPTRLADHPSVTSALRRRNDGISDFWLAAGTDRRRREPRFAGRRAVVVDAEDTFTSMLDHQLRALGLDVRVRRYDEPYTIEGADLVVVGPGPGDPRDHDHPKIAHLRDLVRRLLAERRSFLAVCLSHQVLSDVLGFPLVRRPVPNQGAQREIELFGRTERVGFYNSYAARCDSDIVHRPGIGRIDVSRDPDTGEVHALRGPGFASVQFHLESVLTRDGVRIVSGLLAGALAE